MKTIVLACLACLSCSNLPTEEPSSTTYEVVVTKSTGGNQSQGGNGATGGYITTGGITSAGGTTNTGGTTSTGGTNTGGTTPCWDATTLPTPFGDNTEANDAANNGAEAGWTDGYAIGCANDEQLAPASASASGYFYCWPGGRHRFCVYAAAWATARACVSLSCDGRTVSACAYASAYAFAWSCAGPIWR